MDKLDPLMGSKIYVSDLENIPDRLCFTYCEEGLFLDHFLWCLKMNIWKYYCSDKSPTKKNPVALKGNIQCSENNSMPNYELYRIYDLILRTGYQVDLEMRLRPEETTRKQMPITQKKYSDYIYVGGKWDHAEILA